MQISTVFLILLVASSAYAQNLVITLFGSTTCGGSAIGYSSRPLACTGFAGFFFSYSCSGSNYITSVCSDAACQSCSNVTTPTACAIQGTGSLAAFGTASCGANPSLNGALATAVTTNGTNCGGTTFATGAFVLNSCVPFLTVSAKSTCNSTFYTQTLYADTTCTTAAASFAQPIACTNTTNSVITCSSGASSMWNVSHILYLLVGLLLVVKSKY